MKKVFKRTLATLLTVIMLVTTFPFTGIQLKVSAITGNEIVAYAKQLAAEGHRYVLNTHGPDTFDCSGFVYYVFGHFGISLPYTTSVIYNNPTAYGTVVGTGSTTNAVAGDLISWSGHIAIYTSNGYCIEALNPTKGIGEFYPVDSHTNGLNYKVIRVYGVTSSSSGGTTQPPQNATVSLSQYWYDISDTIKITASAVGATDYYIAFFKDGNRIITEKAENGVFTIPASKYGTGEYSAYFSCSNSIGSIDSKWVSFSVVGAPTNTKVTLNQYWYDLSDTIEINVSSTCSKGQVIGLYKEDGTRLITKDVAVPYKISASDLGIGNYGVYFSVYNGSGTTDTEHISFSVVGKPGYSTITSDKDCYTLNDKINLNVNTSCAKGQVIGLSKNGSRVLTKDVSVPLYLKASDYGVGFYDFYFSVYNGSGTIVRYTRVLPSEYIKLL